MNARGRGEGAGLESIPPPVSTVFGRLFLATFGQRSAGARKNAPSRRALNVAKKLRTEIAPQVERRWPALRAPERSLSDREAVALAWAWYSELVGLFEQNQPDPVIWDLLRGQFSFNSADPRLAEERAPIVEKLLAERGLDGDAVSRKSLAAAV